MEGRVVRCGGRGGEVWREGRDQGVVRGEERGGGKGGEVWREG